MANVVGPTDTVLGVMVKAFSSIHGTYAMDYLPLGTGLTVSNATLSVSSTGTNTPSTLAYFNSSNALSSASLSLNLTLTSGLLDTVQGIQATSTPTFASLYLGSGTINSVAILQADSTTQGVLIPRMTSVQKNAITPVDGLEVYDTTLGTNQYFHNSTNSWYQGMLPTNDVIVPFIAATGNAIQTGGVSPSSGWSCTSNGTTSSNISSTAPVLGVNYITQSITPSSASFIKYTLGTGFPIGRYEVSYATIGGTSTGIFVFSEFNTNVIIRNVYDTFQSGTGGTISFKDQFVWTGGPSQSMQIGWVVSAKNASSTGFFINLTGALEVRRIG